MRVIHSIPAALAIFAVSQAEAIKTYQSSTDDDDDDSGVANSTSQYEEVDNDASDDMDWGSDLDGYAKDDFDEGDTQQEVNAKHEAWKKKAAEKETKRLEERKQWQASFANKTQEVTESLDFPNDVPPVPELDSAREASDDAENDSSEDGTDSAPSPGGTTPGSGDSDGDAGDDQAAGENPPAEGPEVDEGGVEATPSESYIQEAAPVSSNSTVEATDRSFHEGPKASQTGRSAPKNKHHPAKAAKANSFVDLDVMHPSVSDGAMIKHAQKVLKGFEVLQDRVHKLGQLANF
ncbi:hypothetical protein FOZ60_010679 [Perkinsus olseni]|uniref:Uncharacterized protein n=1 Tax=Perkinsus olseni TaxID=32597 RepID=A0A7J6PC53_PEROL|nr:hypothetical protein FOZ60_010679 [Perkinsus olseni]